MATSGGIDPEVPSAYEGVGSSKRKESLRAVIETVCYLTFAFSRAAFGVGCNARLGLAYGSSIESPNPANRYFPVNASLNARNAGSPVQCPGAIRCTFQSSRNALAMR